MGLLDDAVSEFNMTNEGEPKFIQSRYMLGLCCLEKSDFETAITEIQNALGYSYSFGEASEDRIGMHYDLGLAFQGVGNNASALEQFQKVYNLDPAYREVETKVHELQHPHKPDKSLDEELVLMLRYLRLGRLLTHWEEYLAAARQGR